MKQGIRTNKTDEELTPEACWEAVTRRDKAADGTFVYAVATTGVYCRPSCASRPAKRENVEFFRMPAAAEQAGYRPCKRCHPRETELIEPQARVVQAVAEHLQAYVDDPDAVVLSALGVQFGYDPQHVQRLFKDALGVTPKQYVEALRAQEFKRGLRDGETVLDAGLNAGYGSASRTYENGARALGMAPAEYKRGGEGVRVRYSAVETRLGVMLAAATERGLCAVGLYESAEEAEEALRDEFPKATLEADGGLGEVVADILAYVTDGKALDIRLDIQATAFQWRVWRALQAIPRGETRSYAEVAKAIGAPAATRAVASACAANRAAIVIPCHRVIKSDGTISGYRWGGERKREILAAEREKQSHLA